MAVLRAILPIAVATAFFVLLGIGMATAALAALVVAAALVLICNPFGLLSLTMAKKSRMCMAVGFLIVLAACIFPVGWTVALSMVVSAFGLIWYACRFNRIFLAAQPSELTELDDAEADPGVVVHRDLYYSQTTDDVVRALRASQDNPGWEMQLWKATGMAHTQTVLMMSGVAFTNDELWKMRFAFACGCHAVARENYKKDEFKSKIDSLERQLEERNQEIRTLEKELYFEQEKNEKLSDENRNLSFDADYAAKCADEYHEKLIDRGELTRQRVYSLLDEGLTGKEIAAICGVSESKVSRIKNGR